MKKKSGIALSAIIITIIIIRYSFLYNNDFCKKC